MKLLQKIKTFLGLRHKWIAKRGNQLQITIYPGCGVPSKRKYKIVKGQCNKKSFNQGRPDDDMYSQIEKFTPKTEEARILVWHTFHNKTTRYLVILKKNYKNKVSIS